MITTLLFNLIAKRCVRLFRRARYRIFLKYNVSKITFVPPQSSQNPSEKFRQKFNFFLNFS